MTPDKYAKALHKLNTAYAKAENEIKALEIYSGELTIPAINELRYAGRHILRASENIEKDCEKVESEIISANEHCLRSFNDICDASIAFFLEQIRYFEEIYGFTLYTVFKNYGGIREEVYEAQIFILNKRNEYNDRPKFYKESKEHAEKLKRIFEKLNANKKMLEKERNKAETKKMEDTKRFGKTIAFSMMSIALAVVMIAIKILLG